jgi:peptide/nickel transport system substrate-binding protein
MPRTPSAPRLAVALAVTALLPPLLAGCGGGRDDEERTSPATHAVAAAPRSELVSGSAVTWGVDAVPATLNAHHRDATPVTDQVAAAVMPMLFTLDEQGSPRLNPDYLRSAEVTATEPRQQVVYTLNPQALERRHPAVRRRLPRPVARPLRRRPRLRGRHRGGL